MAFFKILHQSKKSRARLGVLQTPHGEVLTPSFVPVATKGTLKTIPPKDIKDIGPQIAFVNTFHLVMHPGADIIEKFGGIHKWSALNIPLMSDSAGFQMFSLGRRSPEQSEGRRRHLAPLAENQKPLLLKISDDGVLFRSPVDGRKFLFTPEFSMDEQRKIGADIIMAFDECVYNGATEDYTKAATLRTHQWLLRCIAEKNKKSKSKNNQFLYGIVQGGTFEDLRVASAQFVANQDVAGIAIGGVSVGETKTEMRKEVSWAVSHLPGEKPKHLLGIGRIEDILDFIPLGIDTFDCVEPTRLARNGIVFQQRGKSMYRIDLAKSRYAAEKNPIEKDCMCYTCKTFSLSFLHHLFKERELLGYYLATYHNLFFFERFFKSIRNSIVRGAL